MTTTNSTSEREQRLKQIRERQADMRRMSSDYQQSLSPLLDDMDYVLSLLDSEAAGPTGWITAKVCFDNAAAVKVVFESPECAQAFIDGIEPTYGPKDGDDG